MRTYTIEEIRRKGKPVTDEVLQAKKEIYFCTKCNITLPYRMCKSNIGDAVRCPICGTFNVTSNVIRRVVRLTFIPKRKIDGGEK